ncbi:MAG: DnaB-like helicase C-terminal domain-containing protein [Mojavia pulchra JT2-VF2]|jgi:hypothetical protein|uniref:DnaB-like helicase C-terminal domain-containing protein n=1 Tax=Mojavia pulchra JT2-VF2 TaxID=287848 RepID=A0A951Q5G0_9NOST|nr:DnaB-like helicase C-terminal domain-containing protein [Mojavia pulchra JT2-VF2]
MAQEWSKFDEKGLARFVIPELPYFLTLPNHVNRLELIQWDKHQLLKEIYKALLAKNIKYAFEPFNSEKNTQFIRTSKEILETRAEGTCLDLAILFCGICLACDLLPVLIVLEGHALAAVSMRYNRQEYWDDKSTERQEERRFFQEEPLSDYKKLQQLINSGNFLAIECTGFVSSQTTLPENMPEGIGRNEDGFLSFERAIEAGKEQINTSGRQLSFAIDIAIAHEYWKIKPQFPLEQHIGENQKIPVCDLLNKHFNNQLVKEKNSRKYIPDIFIEVAEVKDNARFFAHPVLFFQKIISDINSINLSEVNRVIQKLSLQPIQLNWEQTVPLSITIEELYKYASSLHEALSKLRDELDPYYYRSSNPATDTNVPSNKKYVYKEIKYLLERVTFPLILDIEELIERLKLISSHILFIIARAGQGKTNFVCNLAESVLKKRNLPCIFFTGREFNHIDTERISEYLFKSIFGEQVETFEKALIYLNELGIKSNSPVIIIIDGINEHKNIQAFSHHLGKMIEKILEYKYIKLIITCRLEYFEERFSNFKYASFNTEIRFIDNLDRYMSEIHKDHMVKGYFRFFKLRSSYISKSATEVLENDTLLLRMFCEAYGDINAKQEIQLPQIFDIYRDKIFRKYFERKIEEASKYDEDSTRLKIGSTSKYKQVLKNIIELMLKREQYSDIAIADLPSEYHDTLASLLAEDIIFRKDLADVDDILDTRIEVVNFTFDEFRDFLLANHLANVIFRNRPYEFEVILDRIVAPNSPVAEGIRTYLFFASRPQDNRGILEVIGKKDWYKEIFIKSIFSVEEEFIKQEDLNEIKLRFCENIQNSSWIICMLALRWRSSWYYRLNIHLLFEILGELDENKYKEFVIPCVRGSGVYSFNGFHSWNIKDLANHLKDKLDDEDFRNDNEAFNLMELLIYFFPIGEGWAYLTPAFDAFSKFAKMKPDVAITLLKKYTQITNLEIRTLVWRVLTSLVRISEVPTELAQEACEWLLENAETEGLKSASLAKEVVRFLETYTEEKLFWYEDSVVTEMKRYTSRPDFYEQIDDT